jgi:ribonuclease P protein component
VLATAQRLRRRGEFAAAVRAGRRAGRGVVVVHLMVPESRDVPSRDPAVPARAGFIVPKAVGGAVQRNQVKRRLRHLVRERLDRFPAGTDLVVRALPGAAHRSYQGLGTDLDAALAAAGRRKPAPR